MVILVAAGAASVVAALIAGALGYRSQQISTIAGAVLTSDPDPPDQLPVSGVQISAVSGFSKGTATSDSLGAFRLQMKPSVGVGRDIALDFVKQGYEAVHLTVPAAGRILVIRLTPFPKATARPPGGQVASVANIRVRYATRRTETENIGSAVRVFEVVNTGNVPCGPGDVCSPDGKWKAAGGGVTLDAGAGNVFGDVRVSCIAGPCSFSAIEADHFSQGGRQIGVSVRNWSDTVTYLLEAEVYRNMVGDAIRYLYPVIFGQTMSFTLPSDSQGPSIEADLNGTSITFPLGPDLLLSWAECGLKATTDRTKRYRCELKPGYRFK